MKLNTISNCPFAITTDADKVFPMFMACFELLYIIGGKKYKAAKYQYSRQAIRGTKYSASFPFDRDV